MVVALIRVAVSQIQNSMSPLSIEQLSEQGSREEKIYRKNNKMDGEPTNYRNQTAKKYEKPKNIKSIKIIIKNNAELTVKIVN